MDQQTTPPAATARRILVVANQTACGDELLAVLEARVRAGPCRLTLLVPATPPAEHATWTEGEAKTLATRRMEEALAHFRDAGIDVDGVVGDAHPVRAIDDVLIAAPHDEIVLSTLPPGVSRWLSSTCPAASNSASPFRSRPSSAPATRSADAPTVSGDPMPRVSTGSSTVLHDYVDAEVFNGGDANRTVRPAGDRGADGAGTVRTVGRGRVAAAVCEAGALGSLGTAVRTVDQLQGQWQQLRDRTERPFAINHTGRPFNADAFEATLRFAPAAISFHMGLPLDLIAAAHDHGIAGSRPSATSTRRRRRSTPASTC